MDKTIYFLQLVALRDSLSAEQQREFQLAFLKQEKNSVVAFGWSVWFGLLGADRFYVGQPGLGILKLFTLGGLGVWQLVDLFLIGGVARERSLKKARMLRDGLRRERIPISR